MMRLLFLWMFLLAGLALPASGQEEAPAEAPVQAETAPTETEAAPSADGDVAVIAQMREALGTLFTDRFGSYSYGELLASLLIFIAAFALRHVLSRVFFRLLKKLAARTRSTWDDRLLDALERPLSAFLLVLGIFLAVAVLPIEEGLLTVILSLFRGISVLIVFWGLVRVIDVGGDVLAELTSRKGHSIATFIPLMKKAVSVFVAAIGVIMVIDNLGYSVGGILATLGLGGAALAFAAKDTIANLYGSLALALDRPFKVGDWIMVGDTVDGDVESIGLRSTRVRTWPKTQLSIPNNVLANETINNWSRMPKRRVKQFVGVTYETGPEEMEGLVGDIRALLENDEGVQQDFMMVRFHDFGASSLDILVYYFTKSVKWVEHLEVRERINLQIMRAVKARGLSIAFPTRTLYFDGDIARQMAARGGENGGGAEASGSRMPGDHGPSSPP